MTLLIIFCLLILYNFIKGTFQFESVTKTSFIIIPLYALVMTIISIFTEQQEWHLLVTIVLILIGIMLGWFQTFSVRIVKTTKKINMVIIYLNIVVGGLIYMDLPLYLWLKLQQITS